MNIQSTATRTIGHGASTPTTRADIACRELVEKLGSRPEDRLERRIFAAAEEDKSVNELYRELSRRTKGHDNQAALCGLGAVVTGLGAAFAMPFSPSLAGGLATGSAVFLGGMVIAGVQMNFADNERTRLSSLVTENYPDARRESFDQTIHSIAFPLGNDFLAGSPAYKYPVG